MEDRLNMSRFNSAGAERIRIATERDDGAVPDVP